MKLPLLGIAISFALLGCGSGYTPPEKPALRQFTTAEFSRHVYGKSKDQIRREFGSPLVVFANNDSWYYSAEQVDVRDPSAGTRMSPTIQFTGAPSPDDTVLNVTF